MSSDSIIHWINGKCMSSEYNPMEKNNNYIVFDLHVLSFSIVIHVYRLTVLKCHHVVCIQSDSVIQLFYDISNLAHMRAT